MSCRTCTAGQNWAGWSAVCRRHSRRQQAKQPAINFWEQRDL